MIELIIVRLQPSRGFTGDRPVLRDRGGPAPVRRDL